MPTRFYRFDGDWRSAFNGLTITVLGNLDPGPGRDRSAVHHYSDTDYQLHLFQRVAPEFPELRFLGLWHSHHPNGLRELSGGDWQTGLQTVNSDGHELDLLLSSLVVDTAGLLGGRHYVFLRGHEQYYDYNCEFHTTPPKNALGRNAATDAAFEALAIIARFRAGDKVTNVPPSKVQPSDGGLLCWMRG